MRGLSISRVAREIGIRASAIRYYERIGILPAASRTSGQRRYDEAVLHRLALIQRARQTGFTLDEVRQLFFGFREGTAASKRWRKMSERKVVELELQVEQIQSMRQILRRMMQRCHCDTLDECGRALFNKTFTKNRPMRSIVKSGLSRSAPSR